MKHLQEQLTSMQAENMLTEQNAPWLVENPNRKLRWDRYFQEELDLKEDKKLKFLIAQGVIGENDLDRIRRQTEVLMDNFTIRAHAEANRMMEQTTTTNIATFTTWALPLIRLIWPRLFANEIVSVQPMKGPTGRAHTLDFTYCSSGESYSSGSSIYPNEDPDYSDSPGECQEPNHLCLTLTAATLTAVTKKLMAQWSPEASQDLDSQYGLNLENEMTRMLGMQIEREINRTLINGVAAAATTNTNWSSTQPVAPSGWANATPRQFNESIFDAINDADNQIFTRVYEHANFILCGAGFANRLRKLNSFRQIDTSAGFANIKTGPNLFGVLSEQYKVYHDPFYTSDAAIVGHKSDNWLYTGYVYAPYIPLWSSPVIWDKTLCPAKGILSRYATYAKNGNFYATVTVTA